MEIENNIVSVKTLLADSKLSIPIYQRPYKWTSKNVSQLFIDISTFIEKSSYRLGTVVIHKDGDKHEIVDGQQRILTLILTIHALWKYRKDKLERNDLKKDLENLSIQMMKPSFNSDISKYNLHNNFWEITRIVSRPDFTEEHINFLLNRCEVVIFTLGDISEAFQFFDSQNARGKELKPHDLLKAFHLREFHSSDDHLKKETVHIWENTDTEELVHLFSHYLYRIRNWIKGESVWDFGNDDIGMFKGVNLEKIKNYPYIEHLRMTHHFVDYYNNHYERKIDHQKMSFPFHLDQTIVNGRRFFEMISSYLLKVRDITNFKEKGKYPLSKQAENILDTINSYEGYYRRGDGFVRELFNCLLLYYIDKFGTSELSKAMEKIFIWAYSLRLNYQVLKWESVNNYVLKTNLFRILKDSITPNEFFLCELPTLTTKNSTKTEEIVDLFKEMKYFE